MDDTGLGLGATILAAFGALFVLSSGLRARDGESGEESALDPIGVASALSPFALVLAFASRAGALPLHLTFGLVVLLSASAIAVGALRSVPVHSIGGVAGALGVVAVTLVHHPVDALGSWEVAAMIVALATVAHAPTELRPTNAGIRIAAVVGSTGGMVLLVVAMTRTMTLAPWPALAGLALVGALAARQASGDEPYVSHLAAGVLALAAAALVNTRPGDIGAPLALALAVALACLPQVPALLRRDPTLRAHAEHAAALAAIGVLAALGTIRDLASLEAWPVLAAALVSALLVLYAAARSGAGGWVLATTIVLALVLSRRAVGLVPAADARLDFAALAAGVLLVTAWPFVGGARLRESAWSWRGAALAGPLAFLALRHLHLRLFGDGALGLLAIALAALSIAALIGATLVGPRGESERRVAIVWLSVTVSLFVTVAIPLQLRNEWLTIGWALEGAALLAIYRRVDHVGLKLFASALFVVVCVRLVANPYVLGYYERGPWRIVNWLSYTYLVPAAALLAGSELLRPVEVERLGRAERALLPPGIPAIAASLFGAAVVVVFVWLNLVIFDFFAEGPALTVPTTHLPARDLSVSIAWALYALVLLGVGMWRTSSVLRGTSLALLLLTCAKVFLYDLAHLRDLYRVAALVGLALSLIAVSLAYSRFVFRSGAPAEVAR